jgi:hypothetical protein
MAKKRMRMVGEMVDTHIRLPKDIHDELVRECDRLDISLSTAICAAIHTQEFNRLMTYMRTLETHAKPAVITFESDEDKKRFDECVKKLGDISADLRHIDQNLSYFVRDIRSGAIKGMTEQWYKWFKGLNSELKDKRSEWNDVLADVLDFINTDKGMTKKEDKRCIHT